MFFKSFALLALLGVSQAKPTPITLEHDDVLAFGEDGSPRVMKEWEYRIEEDKREVQRRKSGNTLARVPAKAKRSKRACEESTEVQVLEETDFTNWDVAMSPVIGNTGSSAAMVSVSQGYSVANSLSVRSIYVPPALPPAAAAPSCMMNQKANAPPTRSPPPSARRSRAS